MGWGLVSVRRTEYYDIEHKDDQSQDATAGAIVPGIVNRVRGDRGGEGQGGQAELVEEGEEESGLHLERRAELIYFWR